MIRRPRQGLVRRQGRELAAALSTTWGSSASSSGRSSRDIPVVFLPTAASSARRASGSTRSTAPRHHHVRAELRLRARRQAAQGQGRRRASISRACASPAAAPSRSRPTTLREFAEQLAPARFDPKAFFPSYGMAEATLAITFARRATASHADASIAKHRRRARESPLRRGATRIELVVVRPPVPGPRDRHRRRAGRAPRRARRSARSSSRGPSVTPGYFQRARARPPQTFEGRRGCRRATSATSPTASSTSAVA